MAPRFREIKTPHFFKVILKDGNDRNLCIPKKFARAHERDLADTVSLEVASGDTWEVKLFKEDDEFLLQDGWEDFMRHYGVKHGHFLIFRYEGGSKFHVVICDITACEIDYPPKPTAQPCNSDMLVQEPNICTKLRPPVEARKNLQMGSSDPAMMAPTSPDIQKGIHKGIFGGHAVNNCSRRQSSAIETAQKSGALSRASSFQCERPSALFVIHPSTVYPKYCFNTTKEFVRTFIPKAKRHGDIKLCTPGGKSWIVGYSRDRWYPRIRCGWKRFAVDNDLSSGDVCVFESLGGVELSFCVSIFQSRPEGVTRPCLSSCPKRRRTSDRAGSSESGYQDVPSVCDSPKCKDHPFFRVVIQPSALTHSINIPTYFTKDHMEPKVGRAKRVALDATLKVKKKNWPVTIISKGMEYNRYRIVKGWPRFAIENKLQRGDVCVFTLVNVDWVFLVSITREGQD